MGEPKQKCLCCQAVILQSTADQHQGLCVPCHRLSNLPPVRIVDVWALAKDKIVQFVERIRRPTTAGLYRKWSPRLRDFVRSCDYDRTLRCKEPVVGNELAQTGIYEAIIRATPIPKPTLHRVNICYLPLLAIPVAQRLWAGVEDVVFLTNEDLKRWDAIYQPSHRDDVNWWFSYTWWKVSPTVADGESESIAPNETLWVAEWGWCAAPLVAHAEATLWSSDGENCKCIKHLRHMRA